MFDFDISPTIFPVIVCPSRMLPVPDTTPEPKMVSDPITIPDPLIVPSNFNSSD